MGSLRPLNLVSLPITSEGSQLSLLSEEEEEKPGGQTVWGWPVLPSGPQPRVSEVPEVEEFGSLLHHTCFVLKQEQILIWECEKAEGQSALHSCAFPFQSPGGGGGDTGFSCDLCFVVNAD